MPSNAVAHLQVLAAAAEDRTACRVVRASVKSASRPLTMPENTETTGDACPAHDWERTENEAHASNSVQGVYNHLSALKSNRSWVLKRWIWELLQNARDVSLGNASLEASVTVRDGKLTFTHNGRGFEPDEITHLIYYGSTKQEREGTLGQFGSGFITTHLLSPTIEVSGHLTDGQAFGFCLDRRGNSPIDLQRHLKASFEAFKDSLRPTSGAEPQTTTFGYLIDERASEAVEEGARALVVAGPYVTAFNQEFKSIEFRTMNSATVFELRNRRDLAEHIVEVEVDVSGHDGALPERCCYVIAELDDVAVAVPMARPDETVSLESATDVPKLLLGFPLIGTENFSFPAVIHSPRFSPNEERDGVYLGQGNDSVNRENQAALEQACRLLLLTAEFAAGSGWAGTHVLADIPPVSKQKWLNDEWLRDCLKTLLVDPLRSAPLVLTESGSTFPPSDSTLPTAGSSEAVHRLWSLAWHLMDLKDTLPRCSEATGWCKAAQSWAAVYGCSTDDLKETMDGCKLARRASETGSIKALQDRLWDAGAADWLNKLHRFLSENDFDAELRSLKIIPDQNGRFRTLQDLHRDQDIPEELKDIAELAGWNLRSDLRDTRFTVVADEAGAGDIERDDVVPKLIVRLRDRMERQLDDDSKTASARLFAWVAVCEWWHSLDGFPAFSAEDASSVHPIKLLQFEDKGGELPLAPVRTWPEALQRYADLFSRRCILSDDFAARLDDAGVWTALDERGFLRSSVLYTHTQMVSFKELLLDEPLPQEDDGGEVEHKVNGPVEVTNIAFLSKTDIGVLSRVRQNRTRAQLLWNFLVRWLAVEDARSLEAKESMCTCKSAHRYYPAAWLIPLARNQWVPLEERRSSGPASAHSLAQLVRGTEWSAEDLRTNPQVVALLKALGVGVPDLIMELVAPGADERSALDETLAQLLTSVGSDWDRLRTLAEDIQDDGDLFVHLEKRRQRRRIVQENHRLGALVENLVKESLEGEGFDVCLTGVGSDFSIEPRQATDEDQIRLKLTRHARTWLVEIKSTREDSVRMTSVQARTAVKHDRNYLLCVIPITPEPEDPDIEAVRTRMHFVDGIGARLADICANLDQFERVRGDVTGEVVAGLCLELDSGSPRVRIDSTVWEEGFGLENLFTRLTEADTTDDGTAA